jgi:PIN domain nuclease of toxin-antitoxin system
LRSEGLPAEQVLVFDACAVLAFLQQEEGAEVVASLLENVESRRLIHAVNACEVYYDIYRRSGEAAASQVQRILEKSGLEIDSSLSSDLWQTAGNLKAVWRQISLADCFALALTVRQQGTLVTSDHHEMDRFAVAKLCPIRFIR